MFIEQGKTDQVLLISPEWRAPLKKFQTQTTSHTEQESEGERGLLSNVTNGLGTILQLGAPARKQPPKIVIGPCVKKLDIAKRVATLNDDTEIEFEKCLIAVGNAVPSIPIGKVVSRDAQSLVSGAQTISDWNRIDSVIHHTKAGVHDEVRPHLTIVGGGWMSTAVGAALIEQGANVTFSYAEPAFLARYFPKYIAREMLSRFAWVSDGGVDSLSYAALRYIIARTPLQHSIRPVEAEVHIGTVFDSFSIIDFRTDHVIFAPTLSPVIPIDVPSATTENGGYVVNSELMVASDVYAAGAALCVGKGALKYPQVMRWSAEHARSTGRHAALNMLGARQPYAEKPTLMVDLKSIGLTVHVVGDVNGSAETFGYFQRNRERGEKTCGGQLEMGALFYVEPAPRKFRGAAQRLLVTGVALWDGSSGSRIKNVLAAKKAASDTLEGNPLTRPELETFMDEFVIEHLGISLAQSPKVSNTQPAEKGDMQNETNEASQPENPNDEEKKASLEENDTEGTNSGGKEKKTITPNYTLQRSTSGVIWRRHRSARITPVREDELLWIEDEWSGAVSPESMGDKKSQAYTDLLKAAAGRTD